jgi:hypothetical protein
MRFTVESWAPEYGTPGDAPSGEEQGAVDLTVELAVDRWVPILPAPASRTVPVLFVDGVRRVDAGVWVEQEGGGAVYGLCASYAAGAVRCDGSAELVDAVVERGLFTPASDAVDVVTPHAVYAARPTAGSTAEQLWLGIQQRMGELEGRVAAGQAGEGIVVVDGPLSHRRHVPDAVGYVKTHHVAYLPSPMQGILAALPVGRRTPLVLTTTSWSRFSWYLRLAPAPGPMGGIVRCEVTADRPTVDAARLADLVTAMLPRFASAEHKDPRAPQNLYPIGGLERHLRRLLGDAALLYRALRSAAG